MDALNTLIEATKLENVVYSKIAGGHFGEHDHLF
jgi:hypothetical protein